MAQMTGSVTGIKTTRTGATSEYRFAFALVTSLFFIFGFITCLNDILVPHLKTLFDLQYARAALVQFCFFGAYFLVSLPAGKFVQKVGYQRGTVAGLLITAAGCVLFYPAASQQSYPLFLFGLFILASGVTLIQVAVNPYVAVLGPAETSSVRLNLAQAFNSLGTTLAPLVGAAFILAAAVKTPADIAAMAPPEMALYRDTQASSVQGPYLVLSVILILLAAIMGFVHLPQVQQTVAATTKKTHKFFSGAWESPRLVWGAIGIFCYVGAEVAIGSYLINFLGLESIWSMTETRAGGFVAAYWGGAMIGRFVGSVVMKKVSPSKVLGFNALIAAALVALAMVATGDIAAIAILAVGLFNSIMFPTIFTLAIEGLGENTPQGSGILCMAIVGGAIVPLLQGMIADAIGLHHSFWLPIVCYLFIVFYGFRTPKPA